MVEHRDEHGVLVHLVSVDEALSETWRGRRQDADIIRVERPPDEAWAGLARTGIAPKPAWVTWLRAVPATDDDYLRTLPPDERRRFRKAHELAASGDVRIDVHYPVDERTYERFLRLYRREVRQMRRGVDLATEARAAIIAEADRTAAVLAHVGGKLAGACVCQLRQHRSTVYIRYIVTEAAARRAGLARLLYLRVFGVARELGRELVSLGSDPTLYGHWCEPGLFSFKRNLGFRAIPSHSFMPGSGWDEAELVVRLDRLADPSLSLRYDMESPLRTAPWFENPGFTRPPLRGELLVAAGNADTRPYRADFLSRVTAGRPPA